MNYDERVIHFPCAGDTLLGIIAQPEQARDVGVIVVVGGPQYRIGSHRQFTLLSRTLAAAGYPCLRFDYRGMGDSAGGQRGFEEIDEDIAAAIDAFMMQLPALKHVVLWGLCDAASAILMYLHRSKDARVSGLALLNPWVRSETTLARTHIKHHYGQRLFSRDFWTKLATGQLALSKAVRELRSNFKLALRGEMDFDASFRSIMPQALRHFPGKILLVLSGNDYTAKEFLDCATSDKNWSNILGSPGIERVDLPAADHTFSTASWRDQVAQSTLSWLNAITPPVLD